MNSSAGTSIKHIICRKVKSAMFATVYLISHTWGGGTAQYIKNIATYYENNNIGILTNEKSVKTCDNITYYDTDALLNMLINDKSKNIIVHVNINPYVNERLEYFVNILLTKADAKLFITIHDMYWICPENPTIERTKVTKLPEKQVELVQKLFNKTNKLIFPSEFIYNIYKQYYNFENNNVYMEGHPDLEISGSELWPTITGDIIKILYLGAVISTKGIYSVISYLSNVDSIKYNIELHVLGSIYIDTNIDSKIKIIYYGQYSNDNVFDKIRDIQPKIILLSSIVSETWSYTASIALKTGLPIFYNDICVYRERIKKYNRSNAGYYCTYRDSSSGIAMKLMNFIEFLREKQRGDKFKGDKYVIAYGEFYKRIYTI